MIDIAHMFLGNMLHVCFLYITFSTYEFIANNNFLSVVCAKVGFYSPLLAGMMERPRAPLGSLGVSKLGSGTASPIGMTTLI